MNIGAKILWGDLSEGAKEGNFRLDLAGEENFDMSGAKNFRRVARGGLKISGISGTGIYMQKVGWAEKN